VSSQAKPTDRRRLLCYAVCRGKPKPRMLGLYYLRHQCGFRESGTFGGAGGRRAAFERCALRTSTCTCSTRRCLPGRLRRRSGTCRCATDSVQCATCSRQHAIAQHATDGVRT
jgi:hypothetical protein